jgi:hypothetical protein
LQVLRAQGGNIAVKYVEIDAQKAERRWRRRADEGKKEVKGSAVKDRHFDAVRRLLRNGIIALRVGEVLGS